MNVSSVPNFTLIGPYLGISGSQNTKNHEICKLCRPIGATPLIDLGAICRVYAGFLSVQVSFLNMAG